MLITQWKVSATWSAIVFDPWLSCNTNDMVQNCVGNTKHKGHNLMFMNN